MFESKSHLRNDDILLKCHQSRLLGESNLSIWTQTELALLVVAKCEDLPIPCQYRTKITTTFNLFDGIVTDCVGEQSLGCKYFIVMKDLLAALALVVKTPRIDATVIG